VNDYWTPEDDAKGTNVDRWLELYTKDDNNFWRSACGHHQNVIDELIDRLEQADKRAEERIIKLLSKQLWALVDGNLQPINVEILVRNATDFTGSTLPISQIEWLDEPIPVPNPREGENKNNLWTSRPLTDEDKEHYGQEGENK